MTSTNALEAQITTLVRQLKETKEAKRLEEARRAVEIWRELQELQEEVEGQ